MRWILWMFNWSTHASKWSLCFKYETESLQRSSSPHDISLSNVYRWVLLIYELTVFFNPAHIPHSNQSNHSGFGFKQYYTRGCFTVIVGVTVMRSGTRRWHEQCVCVAEPLRLAGLQRPHRKHVCCGASATGSPIFLLCSLSISAENRARHAEKIGETSNL